MPMRQPAPLIKSCMSGANKSCPSEPPALMMPAASERADGDSECGGADENGEAPGRGTRGEQNAQSQREPETRRAQGCQPAARGQKHAPKMSTR